MHTLINTGFLQSLKKTQNIRISKLFLMLLNFPFIAYLLMGFRSAHNLPYC